MSLAARLLLVIVLLNVGVVGVVHVAALSGELRLVDFYIDIDRRQVNARNLLGQTPLMFAAMARVSLSTSESILTSTWFASTRSPSFTARCPN